MHTYTEWPRRVLAKMYLEMPLEANRPSALLEPYRTQREKQIDVLEKCSRETHTDTHVLEKGSSSSIDAFCHAIAPHIHVQMDQQVYTRIHDRHIRVEEDRHQH